MTINPKDTATPALQVTDAGSEARQPVIVDPQVREIDHWQQATAEKDIRDQDVDTSFPATAL